MGHWRFHRTWHAAGLSCGGGPGQDGSPGNRIQGQWIATVIRDNTGKIELEGKPHNEDCIRGKDGVTALELTLSCPHM